MNGYIQANLWGRLNVENMDVFRFWQSKKVYP